MRPASCQRSRLYTGTVTTNRHLDLRTARGCRATTRYCHRLQQGTARSMVGERLDLYVAAEHTRCQNESNHAPLVSATNLERPQSCPGATVCGPLGKYYSADMAIECSTSARSTMDRSR